MSKEHFLIIGARGFIGSWICRLLVEEGVMVTATDIKFDPKSINSVLEPHHINKINICESDARNPEDVTKLIGNDITHVIYLAGLLRPASENDPLLSSQVSICGLINAFNACINRKNEIGIVYASTAAVYGPASSYLDGVIDEKSRPQPKDHYGLHRLVMEMTAEVYFRQHNVRSIGLRPWIVYGAGRFNGLSAEPSLAMLAAVTGNSFHMKFGGVSVFHHVRDVALAFIRSARSNFPGAITANIPGESLEMDNFIEMIEHFVPEAKGKITCESVNLGAPNRVMDLTLERIIGPIPSPTQDRVKESILEYRRLVDNGLVSFPQKTIPA